MTHISDNVKIRRAVATDTQSFIDMVSLSWQRNYASFLPDSYLKGAAVEMEDKFWKNRFSRTAANQLLLVAEIDGKVVAVLCVYGALEEGGEAALESLYVDPEHHRKGIGKAMLAKAAKWCADGFKSTSLILMVVKANKGSVAFYEALGAVIKGTTIWNPSCGGDVEQFEMRWPDISALYKSDTLLEIALAAQTKWSLNGQSAHLPTSFSETTFQPIGAYRWHS